LAPELWALGLEPGARIRGLSRIGRNLDQDIEDVNHIARVVPLDLCELRRRHRRKLRPYLGSPEREA
jgi:hypothetical protein